MAVFPCEPVFNKKGQVEMCIIPNSNDYTIDRTKPYMSVSFDKMLSKPFQYVGTPIFDCGENVDQTFCEALTRLMEDLHQKDPIRVSLEPRDDYGEDGDVHYSLNIDPRSQYNGNW